MCKATLNPDLPDDYSDTALSGIWPTYNGRPWDGRDVIKLYRQGVEPLKHCFDIRFLIKEIEEQLNCYVSEVPLVQYDHQFINFHMNLYNRMQILARVSRVDVHDPSKDSTPAKQRQTSLNDTFELAVYDLLTAQDFTWAQKPMYYRGPLRTADMMKAPLKSIEGRRVFVFPQPQGEVLMENQWAALHEISKEYSLVRAAQVAASLCRIDIEAPFAERWVLARIFGSERETLACLVSPTREFCGALIAAKVNQLLGYPLANLDVHYQPSHVGEADFLARRAIIHALRYILPEDLGDENVKVSEREAYRFVLEHGQYGLGSLTIGKDEKGHPTIDTVRDWHSAKILPAILSRPYFSCAADLGVDREASPSVYECRQPCGKRNLQDPCMKWSSDYFETLFDRLPTYQATLRSGKYARELWYALCDWKGEQEHHEAFFGNLRNWAERILISHPESYLSFGPNTQHRWP